MLAPLTLRAHRLLARLREERGGAMLVALVMVVVTTTLAVSSLEVAAQTMTSTHQDANHKAALEAAEAGLQVALYRLNMLAPDKQHCVGDAVALPSSNGTCASSTTTLANGSTYSYYTTPALSSGGTCVGQTLINWDVAQRCITAVGNAGGTTARSQIRATAFAAEPLFEIPGIIGVKSVSLNGNATDTGSAGSNGTVGLVGNASANGIVLGPGGNFSHSGNAKWLSVSQLSTPLVLAPVNPGTSNQSSLSACPARQAAGYPACNDDYRITNGLQSPAVTPYDPSSKVSFNASTRTLTMSGNGSITLGGGLYNFCEIDASGNATITIAAGVKTEIFLDSPDDPGSGCPAGTGNMKLSGNTTFVNLSGDPTALQLYIYGLNNGSSSISLSGNANFTGVIFAPNSNVTLNGNGSVDGGIAANTVTLNGNAFNWDYRAGTIQAGVNGTYYRSAWAQCTQFPTTSSNPMSGCG